MSIGQTDWRDPKPRPDRGRKPRASMLPAFLVILLASTVFAWRVRVADWYWGAREGSETATPETLTPEPGGENPLALAARGSMDGAMARLLNPPSIAAEVADLSVEPEAIAEAPGPLEVAEEETLQSEADRIRADREELEKIKQAEGEKIAANPTGPSPAFGGIDMRMFNGGGGDRQLRMFMDQQARLMDAEIRRFQAEADAIRRGFLADAPRRPALPRRFERGGGANLMGPDDLNAIFRELDRRQDEMIREMQAGFGELPGFLPPPLPMPGFGFDLPPDFNPPAPDGLIEEEVASGRDGVRRFRLRSKDGRITGYRMEWRGEGR